MEAEFKESVEQEIEEAYRIALPVQLFLMIFSAVISIYILTIVKIPESPLQVKTSIFIVVIAFLWPYLIHVKNRLVDIIGMSLYGGALFSLTTLVLLFIDVHQPRNAVLIIPFMETLGIELFHHIAEKMRKRKSIELYAIDFILSAVFFASIFLFFWNGPYFGGSLSWISSSLIAIVLSTLFFYAILPEREF